MQTLTDKKTIKSKESKSELKLVYSSKKKLSHRHMGCKKCDSIDWRF
jgi:hypothetical protein